MSANAWAAPLQMAVTVAGAGDGSGVTGGVFDWQNAMSMAQFITDINASVEGGDEYYIEDGTYTTGAAIVGLSGGAINVVRIIGVKTGTTNEPPVFSDYSVNDADRPLFAMAGNAFSLGAYNQMQNFSFTSTHADGVHINGNFTTVYNCKVVNTNGIGFHFTGTNGFLIDCDADGSTDSVETGSFTTLIGCYVHDAPIGIDMGATAATIINCIIDTCPTGIDIATRDNLTIIGNVIFNSSTRGISGTTGEHCIALNNTFEDCVIGVEWTTVVEDHWFDFNLWGNGNTDDIVDTDVIWGNNRVEGDPLFNGDGANPPDFTLASGSAAEGVGLQMTVNTGVASADYNVNIGVAQNELGAGGNPRHGTKNGGKQ